MDLREIMSMICFELLGQYFKALSPRCPSSDGFSSSAIAEHVDTLHVLDTDFHEVITMTDLFSDMMVLNTWCLVH